MTLKAVMVLNFFQLAFSYSNYWYTTTLPQDLASTYCFTSCPSGSFCTIKHEQIIANFTTTDTESCKMFCWYAEKCHTFTYSLNTSLCGLYFNEPDWLVSPITFNSAHFDTYSTIDCWVNYEPNPSQPCRSPQDVLKTSRFSEGLLVQQHYTKLCLGIGQSGWPVWKDCTSAPLWKFRENPRVDDDWFTTSVSLYPAGSPDKCLTAIEVNGTQRYKLVSMATCQANREDQDFDLKNGSIYFLQGSHAFNSGERCYFQLRDFRESLYTHGFSTTDPGFSVLNILLPSEYLELCVRDKLKVKGGVVEGTTPFFLPGSSISVSCNPGLVFEELNFTSSLNVTCRDKTTEISNCTNKSAANKSAGNKSLIFALLVFEGLVVSKLS